mgnify:CR=1 FL=1|tara:strand:- start:4477 stop:4665 length:189 start_codon:yes stop_codon:yes gene_type:complete
MSLNKQNPGGQAGASRNQLDGWLHPSIIASDRQAQMPASIFSLSPWMARDMARLCFGEARND